MTNIAHFLEPFGTSGLQAFWLPCLLWTLLFIPCYLALNAWKGAHPFIQYYVRLALLLALPLGLLAAWTTDLPLSWLPLTDAPLAGTSSQASEIFVGPPLPLELFVPPAPWWSWSMIAGGVLMLSLVIALLRALQLCLSGYRLRHYRHALRPAQDPQLQTAIDDTAKQLRLFRPVRGFAAPSPLIPLTFGWLRPHIVVPDELLADPEGLQLTVTHEMTHIRRHDVLLHTLERVLRALFFFHPGVHLLCRSLEDYREMSCDAEVLAQPGVDSKRYARLLFHFSQMQPVQPPFALRMASPPRHLKQRILSMKQHHPTAMTHKTPRFTALLLAVLLCSAGTLFVACSDPAEPMQDTLDARVSTAENQETGEAFKVVDQMPELIGGLKALHAKINYPEAAKALGVEGRVVVQFIVDKQGAVVDPVVVKGVDPDLDEEALRVVREMRFEPGMQNGQNVAVQLSLPISFKLSNGLAKKSMIEKMPALQRSLEELQAQIRYPEAAKEAGIEGRVVVAFLVDEEGAVESPTVIQGIDDALDQEALRVVSELRFEPGMQDGKAVKVKMKLPITFKLPDA